MAASPDQIDADHGLRQYLWSLYQGVFDQKAMADHLRDYVGFTFADQMAPQVARLLPPGAKLLDLGCGFGSFVIAARRLGLDAHGLELAEYEVGFAQNRLAKEFPDLDPEQVFQVGDAQGLPFDDASFEAVTMWNLLEHLPNFGLLLREAKRVLKTGGYLFIICPNYTAFGREAHYLVPWPPALPRSLGPAWLKLFGKNPNYFKEGIHPLSNRAVLKALAGLGLEVIDLDKSPPPPRGQVSRQRLAKLSGHQGIEQEATRRKVARLQSLGLLGALKLLLRTQASLGEALGRVETGMLAARRGNPFKKTVCLWARKVEAS